ncbi:alginate lyase family protein [Pelosinus sp. IPA-1]|uniref:alginate lyase family protein n=1 Tax=Pelosinus sp. IPA-1 TaxID=3029569 RepID=UPI00243629BC|nr:alginate lyase family protein [Pelosinus sp. IPA-1]GMA97313.1 alginate lyase [Pelosinus sp. IPA-1]
MKWSLKTAAIILGALMLMQEPVIKAESFLYYEPVEIKSLSEEQVFPELAENLQSIISAANKALKEEPASVTHKTILPPSGDPHDYVSLGKYWWKDTDQPNGSPYTSRDGLINPEGNDPLRYDHNRLSRTASNIHKLSLAYYLTGKAEYAAKAIELIEVFFISPDTRMNPNLNFAQAIPGKVVGRGSGIIDTVCLIQMTDDLRMLEKSPLYSKDDDEAMRQWFASYLDWLQTSKPGIHERQALNNHGVWYDAQLSAYALFIDHKDLAAQIVKEATVKRVDQQIQPDGSMPKELARTKSMSYTTFNLKAFITLARVGNQVGVNIWDDSSPNGRNIKKAIDYLIPYIEGTAQWQYEQIVPYHEPGFARYLYLAKTQYGTHEYDQAIQNLLKD